MLPTFWGPLRISGVGTRNLSIRGQANFQLNRYSPPCSGLYDKRAYLKEGKKRNR